MSLSRAAIAAAMSPDAPRVYYWAVRWQYMRGTGFFDALLEAIANADDDNRARLALGFPDQVEAVTRWQREPGFSDEVERWATQEVSATRLSSCLIFTTLPNGRWVSTVWLGLDHCFGDGPPVIFETMVFTTKESLDDLDCKRYSTEAEALAGHAKMVEKWSREP